MVQEDAGLLRVPVHRHQFGSPFNHPSIAHCIGSPWAADEVPAGVPTPSEPVANLRIDGSPRPKAHSRVKSSEPRKQRPQSANTTRSGSRFDSVNVTDDMPRLQALMHRLAAEQAEWDSAFTARSDRHIAAYEQARELQMARETNIEADIVHRTARHEHEISHRDHSRRRRADAAASAERQQRARSSDALQRRQARAEAAVSSSDNRIAEAEHRRNDVLRSRQYATGSHNNEDLLRAAKKREELAAAREMTLAGRLEAWSRNVSPSARIRSASQGKSAVAAHQERCKARADDLVRSRQRELIERERQQEVKTDAQRAQIVLGRARRQTESQRRSAAIHSACLQAEDRSASWRRQVEAHHNETLAMAAMMREHQRRCPSSATPSLLRVGVSPSPTPVSSAHRCR